MSTGLSVPIRVPTTSRGAANVAMAFGLVALFLYSLLPILQNTFTGVTEADPAAVEAAEALGMTRSQVARWVRLPLAAPIILLATGLALVLHRLGLRPPPDARVFS